MYYPNCFFIEMIMTAYEKQILTGLAFADTEIDWETYMYHIELYRNGERNYEKIEGPTGLLVCVLHTTFFAGNS